VTSCDDLLAQHVPYGVGGRHHERRWLCDVGAFSFVHPAAERIIKPVPTPRRPPLTPSTRALFPIRYGSSWPGAGRGDAR
jgi:hypothetical protein